MPKLGLGLSLPKTRKVGAGAPPLPIPASGLKLWLKGDAGITLDGNAVIGWADQSGNGNDVASTGYSDPILYPNYINNKPALFFDTNTRMQGSDVTGKTIYAVIVPYSIISSDSALVECTGGGLYSCLADTNQWGSYYNSYNPSGNSLTENTPAIIATLSSDGNSYVFRRDGQQVYGSDDGLGFLSRSQLSIGNDGSLSQPCNSYIAEIIIYNRVLNSQEIQQVENYLNTKYAIYNPVPPIPTNGLKLWLKADAGVTQSHTPGPGASVSEWQDSSGNNNSFNGAYATLINSYVNGKPAIYFDGSTSYLTSPSTLLDNFSELSIIAVWNVAYNGNRGLFGTASYRDIEITTDPNMRVRNDNYDDALFSGIDWFENNNWSISSFVGENGDGQIFKNGVEITSDVNPSSIQLPTRTGITYELGRYAYPEYSDLYAEAFIAEFIIYNRRLNDTERTQIESYLNTKYAVY